MIEKDLQVAFDLIQTAIDNRKINEEVAHSLVTTLNNIAINNEYPLKFKLKSISDNVSELIVNLKGQESSSSEEEEEESSSETI